MGGSGKDEREQRQGGLLVNWRQTLITFFPMLIAVLSLFTSIYNGYLNNKFVTLIQGNLSRAEYMRTCRDAIDAYFQVKYRADVVVREAAARSASSTDGGAAATAPTQAAIEAGNAVARFGALATYLANMRDEKIRVAYTELYWKLDEYVGMAATSTADARKRVIDQADGAFAGLNDDCVHQASLKP